MLAKKTPPRRRQGSQEAAARDRGRLGQLGLVISVASATDLSSSRKSYFSRFAYCALLIAVGGLENGEDTELTGTISAFCFLGFFCSLLRLIWPLAIAFLHDSSHTAIRRAWKRLSTDSGEISMRQDAQSWIAEDDDAMAPLPEPVYASHAPSRSPGANRGSFGRGLRKTDECSSLWSWIVSNACEAGAAISLSPVFAQGSN